MSYTPNVIPKDVESLPTFLEEELRRVALSISVDVAYNQEQLLDKNSTVNTRIKKEGVRVWDSTSKRPLWAAGNQPASAWVDGVGVVVYLPV